jgi:protocatechuate 4,5-dioxygenase beta chain
MAEIVAGFGMPHTPAYPAVVAREGPDCDVARLYADIAAHVAAVKPDVLIVFTDDHFNTFFLDNYPTFAIGVADATAGPNDQTPMPRYQVAVPGAFAAHIRGAAIDAGFDVALVQDFEIDHAVLVPLHFLTPEMRIPVVPIFVNCLAPPLPTARRCYALGEAVRAAILSFPQPWRVAVIGSGSFSLEIGGPKVPPGPRAAGFPDPQWTAEVQNMLRAGQIDELVGAATSARMLRAGNIGGELLDWIAMLGVIGGGKPRALAPHPGQGHAFAVWRWD